MLKFEFGDKVLLTSEGRDSMAYHGCHPSLCEAGAVLTIIGVDEEVDDYPYLVVSDDSGCVSSWAGVWELLPYMLDMEND